MLLLTSCCVCFPVKEESEKKRIEYKLRVVGICIDYYTATRQATIKIDFYSVCNGKLLEVLARN